MRQRRILCNDKRINPPGRQNNPKHARTKQQNLKIEEAKTDTAKRRNRHSQNYTGNFKSPHSETKRTIRLSARI